MGRGVKREVSQGALLGYEAGASDPWSDFFDVNYTLSKPTLDDPDFTGTGKRLDYAPFDKIKLSRFSSDPLKETKPQSGLRAMPSMPIASRPADHPMSPKATLPFDFDDFLATLEPDEPEDTPLPTGSRFRQFFDCGSPMGKFFPQDPPPYEDMPYLSSVHACTNQVGPTLPPQSDNQLPYFQQLPAARRSRHSSGRLQPACRQFFPNADFSDAKAANSHPFDSYSLDDITEADMQTATTRFNTIKEASLASSVNETPPVATLEEKPVTPPPPPVERERPRFKNQSASSSSRWSPPTSSMNNPPPSSMTTAALLQARLLAQQHHTSGIFPAGQVAQLVRPPLPVYQPGMQAGLPLQSAALLSQFVWLNVM